MTDHRQQHITTNIRRAVQEVLARGLADPRIRGLITVTAVNISSDGREAAVMISVLPEQYETRSMQGLTAGTLKIQRLVNKRLAMRRPPHLRFVLDRSLKKQAQVLQAIREAVGTDQHDDDAPTDDAPEQHKSNDSERQSASHAGQENTN